MRRFLLAATAAACLGAAPLAALAQELAAEAPPVAADAPAIGAAPSEAEFAAAAQDFYDGLERRTGVMSLAAGKVELTVPETHYFIGPQDARRVIVDLWGNPPVAAEGVEGMIFPAGANPAAGAWGAVVEYSDEGHVKDDDAATIDYDQLLRDMQDSTRQENEARREQGFDEITLDDWAEAPHYDSATHKLYWAKLLSSSNGYRTLNYDIRVLGREGVFVVSFVANPEEIDLIRASAPAVMDMPAFTAGNTYADYREGVDRTAAYGIGGLIAGGVAVAAAKKLGLLGLILAFGKKAIALVIAAGVGLFALIGRLFRGRKQAADDGAPPQA